MPRYRAALPQSQGSIFLTDGGIETTLIFQYGLELPDFAAFTLLDSSAGQAALYRYFATYADLARRLKLGLVLESPTWRANPDWGFKLGYSADRLSDVHRKSIRMMGDFRALLDQQNLPTVISGNLGPRGDGYVPSAVMTARVAEAYHRPQIEAFAETEADLVSAVDAQLSRRSDRHRARGSLGGDAGGAVVHRGNRWPIAHRRNVAAGL